MPSIDLENAREELYKCLEQTDVVKKDGLSLEAASELPKESFPSECADLKKAFDNFAKEAAKKD